MKPIAVMCASSRFYAFALYVSLWSFLKNSPRLADAADIYIYAYAWDEPLKQIFRSLGNFHIIDYDLPADIERTPFIRRFTPALYSRFEAFSLLEKYERVICLDSDILVQKELFPVLSEFHGPIALTVDDCPTVQNNFLRPIPGYDMSAPCYNAGFIVLNRAAFAVSGGQIRQWLYRMLKQYADCVYLGDQGLINLMLQEFSLPVEICSPLYNLPASSGKKELKQAFIVHSTGHRKFWCYYFFKQWVDGYTKWRQAGGNATTVRPDSARWHRWVSKKITPQNRIFWELAPDGFKYPGKFLLFALEYRRAYPQEKAVPDKA